MFGEDDIEFLRIRTPSAMPAGVVENDVILFAVPKKGRVYEDVMQLLKGAGLDGKRPDRLDVAMCKELPVKLVFLPAHDIPAYVMEGNVDIGISGIDMLEEHQIQFSDCRSERQPVKVLTKLGFGKCKLCLQAPVAECSKGSKAFVGKRIVTSFPNIARRFFSEQSDSSSSPTSIKVVSGSVEAACGLGLADAIVDLVETGTTMRAAGLDVVCNIMETEAVLFQQEPTETNGLLNGKKADVIKTILDRILGYQTSTKFVMVSYNVHEEFLKECCTITPGKRSPTVTKLADEGWHSVSALVAKDKLNSVMDTLTKAGAKDVLCIGLFNTRM